MGWRFTTSFGAEKAGAFSDFLLGGAAGGRLVFSFESSGQGGPMDEIKYLHEDYSTSFSNSSTEIP